MACFMGELGRGAVEVRDYALGHEPVDRVVEPPLDDQHLLGVQLGGSLRDEAPQDAPQQQKLGHDLPRREPERLALARVVPGLGGQRAPATEPFRLRVNELSRKLGNEGRHVAELS